tara:strand:+ start:754 stop:1008 length:255 start_codon:yes stop_codon:yes gene_type:complete
MIDYSNRNFLVFQVGDLVKYNPENRWKSSRTWVNEDANVGVVLEVTEYKDSEKSEVGHVHVKWSSGEKKVYFEEELDIISKKVL